MPLMTRDDLAVIVRETVMGDVPDLDTLLAEYGQRRTALGEDPDPHQPGVARAVAETLIVRNRVVDAVENALGAEAAVGLKAAILAAPGP